jgi:hypothetical protein
VSYPLKGRLRIKSDDPLNNRRSAATQPQGALWPQRAAAGRL